MSTCMAMGEAAGRAAKQAVQEGLSPSKINVAELRQELLAKGAYLSPTIHKFGDVLFLTG